MKGYGTIWVDLGNKYWIDVFLVISRKVHIHRQMRIITKGSDVSVLSYLDMVQGCNGKQLYC